MVLNNPVRKQSLVILKKYLCLTNYSTVVNLPDQIAIWNPPPLKNKCQRMFFKLLQFRDNKVSKVKEKVKQSNVIKPLNGETSEKMTNITK